MPDDFSYVLIYIIYSHKLIKCNVCHYGCQPAKINVGKVTIVWWRASLILSEVSESRIEPPNPATMLSVRAICQDMPE